MLKIRLKRVGKKHEPVFRLVLTDSKNSSKSGRFLEMLGNYDARRENKAEIKNERVKYWVSQGAQLSNTVHNVLIENKIIEGKKINVLPKKKLLAKENVDNENKEGSEKNQGNSAPAEEVVSGNAEAADGPVAEQNNS